MAKLDHIVCYESGSGEQAWSGSLDSLSGDYATLLDFDKKKLLHVERIGDRLHIKGTDRVGLLSLPSGRRVVIKSKVPNIALLQWLAFIDEVPQLESWEVEPAIAHGGRFHDCIGRLFICELDQLTRRFLRKDFVSVKYSSSTLRGKVLVNGLCRAMHRLPNVPQSGRVRTFDAPYNVVLALALDKVPMLMSDRAEINHQDMARLRDEWAYISRETPDVFSAVVHAQWGCPFGYRNALRLARLILLGAVVDPTSGAGGEVFTLSLAKVWEDGLLRIFDALQPVTGWKVLKSSRPWADMTDDGDTSRWMTADILVERKAIRWVLDTKYKASFGDESREDRFQVCAYALGFDAKRATLAYPTGLGTSVHPRLLLDTNIGGGNVKIDSVELPMAKGPEACKEAILALCAGCSLTASEEDIEVCA